MPELRTGMTRACSTASCDTRCSNRELHVATTGAARMGSAGALASCLGDREYQHVAAAGLPVDSPESNVRSAQRSRSEYFYQLCERRRYASRRRMRRGTGTARTSIR